MIFLGCDGGSTKTEWLLAEDSGRVLSHRTFTGCNYAFLGQEGFAQLMAENVRELLREAGGITAGDITAAMLGLTIYGELPDTEKTMPAAVEAALPGCGEIILANDSLPGWAGSLAVRPGVNIVAGTGSVAYGRDLERQGKRVGGWSLFFADEGSCSWVARQLIEAFVKQADGRCPRSPLYEAVRADLSITNDLYFSGYLQDDLVKDSALLAKLQLTALRAAQRGDAIALDIYRRAAAELADTAEAVRQQLRFPEGAPVRASYSGGLFRAGEVILSPFREEMECRGFTLAEPAYSPIVGALALAAEKYLSQGALDRLMEAASGQL